ncbi:MAG TPA: NBR1-Ig-like domain-containing protein [Anaerolineales bacterium]|nr:NBR1-Ig-like domain-containing protein [Anaerolineales bacterium]
MKRSLFFKSLMVLLALLLAGCNLPGAAGPDDEQMELTYVAQTISAGLTQNAPSGVDQTPVDQQPTDQQPDTPTDTPQPSNTPIPTNTPQPTATPTETIPCNQAGWVKDVTVPDGTTFAPGESFTKTWRLENTGSCNWNGDYEVVFDSGDKMNGGNVVDLSIGTIEPGENVDISVDLKAPNTPGDYKGNWLLRSDDSVVFGLGANDIPFYVDIEVVDPVSFEVLSTNHYTCSSDKYVAMRVKNTGTEELESSAIGVKNLDTDTIVGIYFGHNNNPFTENDDDCPPMGIDDIEAGDIYYLTYNMGSASANYEFSIELCTAEDGGGDCVIEKATHNLP